MYVYDTIGILDLMLIVPKSELFKRTVTFQRAHDGFDLMLKCIYKLIHVGVITFKIVCTF